MKGIDGGWCPQGRGGDPRSPGSSTPIRRGKALDQQPDSQETWNVGRSLNRPNCPWLALCQYAVRLRAALLALRAVDKTSQGAFSSPFC